MQRANDLSVELKIMMSRLAFIKLQSQHGRDILTEISQLIENLEAYPQNQQYQTQLKKIMKEFESFKFKFDSEVVNNLADAMCAVSTDVIAVLAKDLKDIENIKSIFQKKSDDYSAFDRFYEMFAEKITVEAQGSMVEITKFIDKEEDDLTLALKTLGVKGFVQPVKISDLHAVVTKRLIDDSEYSSDSSDSGSDDAKKRAVDAPSYFYLIDLGNNKWVFAEVSKNLLIIHSALKDQLVAQHYKDIINAAYVHALKEAQANNRKIKKLNPVFAFHKQSSQESIEHALFNMLAMFSKRRVDLNVDAFNLLNNPPPSVSSVKNLEKIEKNASSDHSDKQESESSADEESKLGADELFKETAKLVKTLQSKRTTASERKIANEHYAKIVSAAKKDPSKEVVTNAHLKAMLRLAHPNKSKTLVRARKLQELSGVINNTLGETDQVRLSKQMLSAHFKKYMIEELKKYKASWTQRRTGQVDALLRELEKENISVDHMLFVIAVARDNAIKTDANINTNRMFLPRRDILKSRFIQMLDVFHMNLVSQLTVKKAEDQTYIDLQWHRLADLIATMDIMYPHNMFAEFYRGIISDSSSTAKYQVAKDLSVALQMQRKELRAVNPDFEKLIKLYFVEVENLNQYFNQTKSLRNVTHNEEASLHKIGEDLINQSLRGELTKISDEAIKIPVGDDVKVPLQTLPHSQRESVGKVLQNANAMVASLINNLKSNPKYKDVEFGEANVAYDQNAKTLRLNVKLNVNRVEEIEYKFTIDVKSNIAHVNWPKVVDRQNRNQLRP